MGFDYTAPLQCLAKLLVPLGLIGRATDYTNVFYKNADGVKLHAYLRFPPDFNATQTYPAALVFHAWNGMSEEPVYFSDLLAQQGYIVMAPDLFRNVATGETNIPWNIATVSLTPQDRMNADIDAAIDYLTQTKNVDKKRIFSGPGFCFGGSQATNLGIRRPMMGTVSLYGANIDGLQDGSNDILWGNMGASGTEVLGIYGSEDGNPTPETARGFEAAMTSREIPNTVTIYDGVGHAFVNPTDHSDGKAQAVAAWDQIVDFINAQANPARPSPRALETLPITTYQLNERPSLSWLWDHAMDFFYGKGHFSHASYGLRNHENHAFHGEHPKKALWKTLRDEEKTEPKSLSQKDLTAKQLGEKDKRRAPIEAKRKAVNKTKRRKSARTAANKAKRKAARKTVKGKESPTEATYQLNDLLSMSWVWDHAMGYFYSKRHVGHHPSHGLRHQQKDVAHRERPEKALWNTLRVEEEENPEIVRDSRKKDLTAKQLEEKDKREEARKAKRKAANKAKRMAARRKAVNKAKRKALNKAKRMALNKTKRMAAKAKDEREPAGPGTVAV